MIIENGMNKIINTDWNILKEQFLKHFLESLEKLKNNNRIVIWLSWWNSLKIFYEIIKNNFSLIDKNIRKKIYFCFLDERVVSFDDENSNYKLCKDLFLDQLIQNWFLKQQNILLPNFTVNNYSQDYFERVKKIDIWLFWVGEDGHTASLFPNHTLLEDNTYSYLKIEDSPKLPLKRITISKSILQDVVYSFVFFMWDTKKEAWNNFLDENRDYKNCPIKLTLKCQNTIIITNIC